MSAPQMSGTPAMPKMSVAPLLQVRQLKKAYGAIQAVAGVSFEVMPGEIFGVIGPNGSGKTTCSIACWGKSLQMLARFS